MLQRSRKYSIGKIRKCYYYIEKTENIKYFKIKSNAFPIRELSCVSSIQYNQNTLNKPSFLAYKNRSVDKV